MPLPAGSQLATMTWCTLGPLLGVRVHYTDDGSEALFELPLDRTMERMLDLLGPPLNEETRDELLKVVDRATAEKLVEHARSVLNNYRETGSSGYGRQHKKHRRFP